VLTTRFQDEPGKTLADLLRQVKAEAQRHKVWEQKPPASTSEPGSDAG